MHIYSYRKYLEAEPRKAKLQEPRHSASRSQNQTKNRQDAAKAQICAQSENTSCFHPSQPSAWQEGHIRQGQLLPDSSWNTNRNEMKNSMQMGSGWGGENWDLTRVWAFSALFHALLSSCSRRGLFPLTRHLLSWDSVVSVCSAEEWSVESATRISWPGTPTWGWAWGGSWEATLSCWRCAHRVCCFFFFKTSHAGISSLHQSLCLNQQCISWTPFPKVNTGGAG